MIGIGGSTAADELAKIQPTAHLAVPIEVAEYRDRMAKASQMMQERDIDVLYLHAGSNLYYYTGLRWRGSERLVGALLYADGTLQYVAPKFEEGTILDFLLIEGDILCWEEHESPYQLVVDQIRASSGKTARLGMDETTPFFVSNGIASIGQDLSLTDAKPITAGCRMIKSAAEIALIQHAMDITLEVQQAAARILCVGISTEEVVAFIHEAHKRHGITSGSYFCIVLFGVDSSFPHGVKAPQALSDGDVVLIDTGCILHDYISDITRTYVYGDITEEQRRIWHIEQAAQLAAFDAAQLGNTCSSVDDAARATLTAHGLGPDYDLPGLPHRAGHGIGLNIHEWPYIVRGDETALAPGMCFSIEPMICVPNKFGIRHEDHVYMTAEGPQWFTSPMHSIEDPFGLSD